MFDFGSELMFLQAYWNDRRVRVVVQGGVVAAGICRVYEKTPWRNGPQPSKPKIIANVKQEDGSWIREVELRNLREIDDAEYEARLKREKEAEDDIPF